ncbi:hypothetical protein JMJ77_0003173, partial [Colletotrichum scovillei]
GARFHLFPAAPHPIPIRYPSKESTGRLGRLRYKRPTTTRFLGFDKYHSVFFFSLRQSHQRPSATQTNPTSLSTSRDKLISLETKGSER